MTPFLCSFQYGTLWFQNNVMAGKKIVWLENGLNIGNRASGLGHSIKDTQCTFQGFKIVHILNEQVWHTKTDRNEALGRILIVLTNFIIGFSRKAREKPGKARPIWRSPDASNEPEIFFYK